ncbi:hypothetical protein FEE59_24440 [Herbaspirillum sp. RU 5E]|nr:hypothetical protein [Herbaspirillum sp. RU 5E]
MANITKNKGRRLRLALNRFASMLMEEARDISGLSIGKLDEQLGLAQGQCQRYATYPPTARTRAPQADEIQNLENLVARFLKRPAHVILLVDNSKFHIDGLPGQILGAPDMGLNLRDGTETDFELSYEDEWPTYRRLKYGRAIDGIRPIELYRWQWGYLWERKKLQLPWTREAQGIPQNTAIEPFLEGMVAEWKQRKRNDRLILNIGIKVFADSSNEIVGSLFSAVNENILTKLRKLNSQELEVFFTRLKGLAEEALIGNDFPTRSQSQLTPISYLRKPDFNSIEQ